MYAPEVARNLEECIQERKTGTEQELCERSSKELGKKVCKEGSKELGTRVCKKSSKEADKCACKESS